MKPRLFLIANATEARLFSRASDHEPLVPLATFDDAPGRRKGGELAADRPGHGSSDHRPGGVAFEARVDPRRKRHLQFAQHVSGRVEEALAGGSYGAFVLVASCPFLGEVKGSLGHAARRALEHAIDLDLTSYGLSELEQRLDHALRAEVATRTPR